LIKTLRLASGQPLLIISAELPLGLSSAEEIRLAKQALVANADDEYAGIAIARELDRIADADQDLADVIELLSDPNLTPTHRSVSSDGRTGNDCPNDLEGVFVWPPFRRRGYGTILDVAATLATYAWNSEVMQIPLYEADGQAAIRIAGRRFAAHRGYNWKWQTLWQPGGFRRAACHAWGQALHDPAYLIALQDERLCGS
jgi:GNAT superfamily N-acetyltransferase